MRANFHILEFQLQLISRVTVPFLRKYKLQYFPPLFQWQAGIDIILWEEGSKISLYFKHVFLKLDFSGELFVLVIEILMQYLFFSLLQFEETSDTNNSNSHVPRASTQCLNDLSIQESLDGWLASAQSTQSGQNLASSAYEPDTNLEEGRQIEVLA